MPGNVEYIESKKKPLANTFNIYITIEPNIFKTFFSSLISLINYFLLTFFSKYFMYSYECCFKSIVFFRRTVQEKKCINK